MIFKNCTHKQDQETDVDILDLLYCCFEANTLTRDLSIEVL